MNTTDEMNRMYRVTRYVYDLSRKYYLLGRDQLLRQMEIRPGDQVLEVGCGTARNLVLLARKYPHLISYGLDASTEMLVTAQAKIERQSLQDRIILRHELAENLDYKKTFGLKKPLEVIFFSYSLSMIPTWPQAIDAALANLAPGRALYVVDFWDQAGWPGWFRALLKKWLDAFHVQYRPELLEYLRELEKKGVGQLSLESVAGRYAYVAMFRKAAND